MFLRIHPFIAFIHLFTFTAVTSLSFWHFVRSKLHSHVLSINPLLFFSGPFFTQLNFFLTLFLLSVSNVMGFVWRLGLSNILSKILFLSTTRLSHLFILRQAAFVALYLLVNRMMKCRLNRCRLGQSVMILWKKHWLVMTPSHHSRFSVEATTTKTYLTCLYKDSFRLQGQCRMTSSMWGKHIRVCYPYMNHTYCEKYIDGWS